MRRLIFLLALLLASVPARADFFGGTAPGACPGGTCNIPLNLNQGANVTNGLTTDTLTIGGLTGTSVLQNLGGKLGNTGGFTTGTLFTSSAAGIILGGASNNVIYAAGTQSFGLRNLTDGIQLAINDSAARL
jgi:hypothetical protein